MEHIQNFIVCRVYKGSVRFNTIATNFKKSREHVQRLTKLHNTNRLKAIQTVHYSSDCRT